MALIVNDRVRESTTVVGTGTATLLGAITGYQAFSVIGNGNTCYYTIADQIGANWEVGIGTYTSSGNTLARTTVLKSSNSNNLVSFTAGTKDVFVTYPAETAVFGGGGGTYPTVQPSLNLDIANTKQLDPRITFVRNSTATYYDGQTSALAEQNLFVYSQQYVNLAGQWGSLNTTMTINASTAPDETSTANNIVPTTTNGAHYISQLVTLSVGTTYTVSFFAKPNGYNYIEIELLGSVTAAVYDISAGTVGTTLGSPTTSIVSVGNGWYRCTLTKTISTAGTAVRVYLEPSNGTAVYAGNGTSGVYLWGAQLEQRSSATAYTPTTTAAITNYIPQLMTAPANVARFDCDPITRNSLGLLIEESRTNLLTYSSVFSSALWLTFGTATKTTDTVVAPDGTITGCIVSGATSIAYVTNNLSRIYNSLSPSTAYTFSLWIKSMGTATSASVSIRDNTTGNNTIVVATINSTWQRVSVTATTSASTTSCYFQVGAASADIAIWGAQLEAGAFATSYIPTVASTVTRAIDAASMTGTNFSSWYNQSQGSFYVDANVFDVAEGPYLINSSVATTTRAYQYVGVTGFLSSYDGSNAASSAGYTSTNYHKSINTYSSILKTMTLTFDGKAPVSSGYSGVFANETGINLMRSPFVPGSCGHIRKLSYYPVALSSSNLVALTS